MYFFLSKLSFIDISTSTTTIPKILVSIQARDHKISYTGCLTQACCALIFAGWKNCLLAVMAYDCYMDIFHPLRYTVIMNPFFCVLLILFSLIISTVHSLLHSLMLLLLSFCTNLGIHLFCELAQVIKLACSDTLINKILVYSVGVIFLVFLLLGLFFLTSKLSSLFWKFHQWRDGIKHFPPVGLTSQFCP
jgi:olfactory receptor